MSRESIDIQLLDIEGIQSVQLKRSKSYIELV